ncbi:MAG: Gfo/Idh/MocA family oxidoreductase [Bacteroidales bacterium]|nr:Gfo/Idh/MocA family oxidoreductase [Clostridium sp.]MCM1202995.1 Gfo/Idh/MocA family oxidoreductase [Bacteroidales bacterium]
MMKLGILGTGMIVKDLLQTADSLGMEKIYLLGTLHSMDKTKELCRQYHLDGYYFDYEEMLNTDIDTVYVALPNFLHYRFARQALQSGKHVIIEKPAAANAEELDRLIKLAEEKQCIILEAMNIHYLPAYQSLKEKVCQLDRLKIVSFDFSQYSSRYDAFKRGEVLPVFDYKKAGGALMDINVYNVHAIVGIWGAPRQVQYFANVERNIDTSGILMLDYGDFKAVAIGAKDCQAPVSSTIQGDTGYIRIDGPVNGLREYKMVNGAGEGEDYRFSGEEHRLSYEFREFIRIIEEKDFAKAEEMLTVSITVARIMQEARRQQGIVFPGDDAVDGGERLGINYE